MDLSEVWRIGGVRSWESGGREFLWYAEVRSQGGLSKNFNNYIRGAERDLK